MPVVVLPRWAGALAAAASLTVAGLATVSAETVPAAAATHLSASGPSASPRFAGAHHVARLPSGFTQVCPQPASPGVMQCSIVVHSASVAGGQQARLGDSVAGPAAVGLRAERGRERVQQEHDRDRGRLQRLARPR